MVMDRKAITTPLDLALQLGAIPLRPLRLPSAHSLVMAGVSLDQLSSLHPSVLPMALLPKATVRLLKVMANIRHRVTPSNRNQCTQANSRRCTSSLDILFSSPNILHTSEPLVSKVPTPSKVRNSQVKILSVLMMVSLILFFPGASDASAPAPATAI